MSDEIVWVIKAMRRKDGEPLTFELVTDDQRSRPQVFFDVEERQGRLEVVRLTITARPKGRGLRTGDLGRLNVDQLLRGASTAVRGPRRGTAEYKVATRPGRPRKVDRALLERVARTYLDNQDWAPRRAVAEAHDVSISTASNYIREARAQGLIPA